VPNTRGSKTADRSRRWLPLAPLACAALAAWLAGSTAAKGSDDSASPSAKISRSDVSDDDSTAALPTADQDSGEHTTHLKWRPYRPHPAQASDVDSAETKSSEPAPAETVATDDDRPAVFEPSPLPSSETRSRVIHDPAVVRTQALQSPNPSSNAFGDDQTQPNAQPVPGANPILPSPTPGGLAPPATESAPSDSGITPFSQRPRATRPGRAPARLNPTEQFDTTPTTPFPVSPSQSVPGMTPNPSPSDMQDLSCATHQRHCNEDEAALMKNTISKIGLDIDEYGKQGDAVPCECSLGAGVVFQQRQWPLITYTWKASALCHKPLYFEEVQLERYGHSAGPIVEPLLSAAHFFITVPLLPYYMGVDPPLECQYTLGYYRPGDCAPYMFDPFPLSLRGAALEAGAVVGVTAVIP
jgi:hypothetical protein